MSSTAQLTRPLSLEKNPFSASAAVPYIGRPLQTAFQEIIRQIDRRTRTILVTGGASTGKTLLVDMTARACNDKGLSVRRVIRGDLLHMMLDQRSDVLLVDEANSVPEGVLHAISPEGGKNPAATAIFFGVPSSVSRFLLSKVHPFMIELPPLPLADARNYLLEQAKRAGVPELFTAEALDIIVAGSQGSPRLLRSHASMAYFGAVAGGASQIGRNHAESALVGQIPFSAPTSPEFAIPARRADAVQPSTIEIPVQPQQPAVAELPSNIRKVRENALLVRCADKLSAELQGSGKVPAETAAAAIATIGTSALGSGTNTDAGQPAEIAADTGDASESADTAAHDDAAHVEQQQPTEIAANAESVGESVDAFAAEDHAQHQEQQPAEIVENAQFISVTAGIADDGAHVENQQPAEIAANTEAVDESTGVHVNEEAQPAAQHPFEIAPPESTDGFAWTEANPAVSDDDASIAANEEKPAEVMEIAVAGVETPAAIMSTELYSGVEPLEESVVSETVVDAPVDAAGKTDSFGAFAPPRLARHRRTSSADARPNSWVKRGALAAGVLIIIGAAAAVAIVEPSILSSLQSRSPGAPQSAPVSAGAEVTLTLRPAIPAEVPKPTENVPVLNATEKSAPAAPTTPNVTEKSAAAAAPAVATVDVVAKPPAPAAAPKPATRRTLTPEEQAAVERGIRALEAAASQAAPLSNRR